MGAFVEHMTSMTANAHSKKKALHESQNGPQMSNVYSSSTDV